MNRRKGVLQVQPLVKDSLHSFSVYGISNAENYTHALLQEFSWFITEYMLHGNPIGAKTWCHVFISLFPFQKKKLSLILIFLQAEERSTSYVCERMAPPWPPEESSSQEHLCAPTEACPNWVLGIRSLLFKCPTILQYLFPTCLMAMIAWEGSSPGKLSLGLDTAMLTAANVHWNLVSVQLLWNSEMPLLFPFSQPTRLSKAS